jgi:hypothetical protein
MLSKNVKRTLILLPLLVIFAGLLYWHNPNLVDFLTASDAKPKLADLHRFDLLHNTFDSDSGNVRLITQLSPT